jgi:hypothetical protein
VFIGGLTQTPGTADTQRIESLASNLGAIVSFPYAGSGIGSGLASVLAQGLLGATTEAVAATVAAINAAASSTLADGSPAPINIVTFSGGAQAFNSALELLSPEVRARIANVLYLSPGASQLSALATGSSSTTALYYNVTGIDHWISSATPFPRGIDIQSVDCQHSATCMFVKAEAMIRSMANSACDGMGLFLPKSYDEEASFLNMINRRFGLPPKRPDLPTSFWIYPVPPPHLNNGKNNSKAPITIL